MPSRLAVASSSSTRRSPVCSLASTGPRAVYFLPHSSGMVLPAATKPRPLILARTFPRSPDTTCLGSAEILQVDYAARKWPGITWLLDHMSYPYPPGDMSAGADLGNHNVTFILRLSIPRRVVCVVRTISAMIVRTGKDNWAGYRPVLDLARHPNIMYASLPEGSGRVARL